MTFIVSACSESKRVAYGEVLFQRDVVGVEIGLHQIWCLFANLQGVLFESRLKILDGVGGPQSNWIRGNPSSLHSVDIRLERHDEFTLVPLDGNGMLVLHLDALGAERRGTGTMRAVNCWLRARFLCAALSHLEQARIDGLCLCLL